MVRDSKGELPSFLGKCFWPGGTLSVVDGEHSVTLKGRMSAQLIGDGDQRRRQF